MRCKECVRDSKLGRNAMRKTVHLCLKSKEEVMYRSEADLIMGFNCLALAVLETEARLLAEGFMSTHNHNLLQSDDCMETMRRHRYAYTRYFNAKYSRRGRLGEPDCFCLDVEGLHHTTAALNYVLRQGLHHGVASTPFGYPHCSANAIFRKELGKDIAQPLMPRGKRYMYMPGEKIIDADKYRMSENGLLLREDIVDTAYVEEIYISPRNFLFQMNRISGERDLDEQKRENTLPPVTVELIESGVPGFDAKKAHIFEQGRVDRNRMGDLELCGIIDQRIVPEVSKGGQTASIYRVPESRRAAIAETLWRESCQSRYRPDPAGFLGGKYVTEAQLRRCLCLK